MGSLMVWAAMLLVGSSAWAADLWPGTGSWTNATIWWSLYRVPVSTDNAFIANAYTVRVDSPAPNVNNIYFVQTTPCGTVEVNAGGSLEVLGNIYVQNSANITTLNVQGGSLTVDGYLAVYNLSLTSGILDMTDGALTAYGTFTFSDGTLKNPTTIAIGGTSPGNLIQSGGMLERSSSSGTTSLGAYTLNGNSVVVVSNGTLSVAGGISNLVATGQSVLRVEGGTLNLNSKSATVGQLAFRSGTISSVGATGFTLNGTNDALVLRNTTNAFNINLTGSSGGNIVFENDNNGTGIMSGNVDLGGLTRTINVGDGSAVEDLRISGAIANGGLTKSGAGTLTLSGINTYSGATLVPAGTLLVGTGGSCLNSPVVVADGATNGVLILTYGGQWTCSSLTYTGSSAGLAFDLANFPPRTDYAPLQINGDLNVTGTVAVVVRNGYWPSVGTYPLVSYSGTLNGPGSFSLASLPENVTATLVNNTGAKRLDLNVTAVPTYAQQTLSVWTNLVSGNASGTWGTSANWSGGVANATDAIADFSTLNITATSIVTNDVPHTVGTLRFADKTTASSNWIVTNSTLALATTVGLPIITVSNQTATIYSLLTGSQGLIKNGAGTLSLNATNTFTGGTTIDQGTLTLNASDVAVRGTVTVNAGGTLSVAGPQWVGFGGGANKITTLNLVGGTVNNTQSAAYFRDATVNMTAGTWSGVNCYWLNSTLNTLASTNPSTLAGPIYFRADMGSAGANLNINVADGAATIDLLISGVISDGVGPGRLTKSGAGLAKITAVNTYTGGTTVNGGPMELLASNNVGRIKGVLTVNSGATVITTGDGTGFGTNQLVTLNITNGLVKAISSDCAIRNITNGVNMTGGELQSNGGTNSVSGYAFQWNRTPLTVNASAGTALISGRINFRSDNGYSNSIFAVANGSADPDLCVNAALTGTNSISKTGAGAMVFAGSNTYSAVTMVSNGLLRVDGTLTAGGGEVQVSDGATLAGTGTVARVITVASNAVLTAGNPSVTNRVGTLTASASTTLAAGAVYAVRIGAAGCDTLAATGGLTLTEGAELSVIADPTLVRFPSGYSVTIATGTVTGRFKESVINLPNQPQLKVSYTGNTIKLIYLNGTLLRFL
jgi:autotransporter-associated beta strand protein